LGFLTKETGLKMAEKAGKGGPLGELVQWSDLLAASHILGHTLLISSETNTFLRLTQN
jgi:alpha-1,3(6)-mannosylglycoprotein beta-1,6-N-acetyl-glucosaminyltransferase